MLHYRAQLTAVQQAKETLETLLAAQQQQIHELHHTQRLLQHANEVGAQLINQKNQAGTMFWDCNERMATLLGQMRRAIPETEVYMGEAERIFLRADFAAHLLHGVNFEADEVIDLTGEETEEDEEESVEL